MGALAVIVLGPAAFTQGAGGPGGFGGGGFGGGGRGGGGRGFGDPDAMFKMYAGDKDVIDVSTVKVPQWMSQWVTEEQLRKRMNDFLQTKGITSGKMTKDVFQQY